MAIALNTLSAEQQIMAVYIGYYDRAADPTGFDFWIDILNDTSLGLSGIATDFSTQSETQSVHGFFSDPSTSSANAFITEVYLNLFNREPDAAGLEFWSDALQDAINGVDGAISVGEIILAIIAGAQDVDGGTQDRTTILNKIEVGLDWTNAADAAGIDYSTNAAAQASAHSIISDVDETPESVVAAKTTTDAFFADDGGPVTGVPGETYFLTSATDVMSGTENDDEFNAYIQQNPFAGGVSNSLSSADRLDGGAGNDRLYAEITGEFVGVVGNVSNIDIQPRLKNIEEIDLEARESNFLNQIGNFGETVTVDGKNITDHVEIGSYFSDADLKIENLTTLTNGGSARNTSEITVTMDHTDNFNTDGDASDLTVLFDNDYLLSGQESEGEILYFLLDEDAELANNPNRLENIDVDGIRFNITNADGTITAVTLESDAANEAGTHQGFVNALQAPLQALIADGTLPAGTTLTLDPTRTDFTFVDDGSQSDDIPAIVLTSGNGAVVTATGYSRVQEAIGEYNVYGRFESRNETADQPITIDIDLHKVGRGGDGGDLIVGGKSVYTADGIADGIEVFNINVKGAGNNDSTGLTKPSNLGTITSTGSELRVVNIVTDAAFASGSTFASLTVRNGFDQSLFSNQEDGDLQMINADGFLGDLTLGDIDAVHNSGRITNADTITAQGGGDVTLGLLYDGEEVDQAYSVTTGAGDDDIDIDVEGDAVDYANSSLNVSTGGGDDFVTLNLFNNENGGDDTELNQAILDNILIETGDGDDTVDLYGVGVVNINTGTGDDTIYTDGDPNEGGYAAWALNFDANRVDDVGDASNFNEDDLPGEQTSLAYVGGATVTVTLSGAGIDGNLSAGGGVMTADSTGADDVADGATPGNDGYEVSTVIGNLLNGNKYYGDQRDVNAAVMKAINDDPVLSKLLVASIASNNTVVVRSLTSGDFEDVDLRIEIDQRNFVPASGFSAVQSEARSVFNSSAITVTTIAGANAAAGNDLETSGGADAWYDGLSAEGDAENSMSSAVGELESNLFADGNASTDEVDTVINAGAGNDVIVLSTEADGSDPDDFTVSSNNALLNGASNETIVLTGSDFGDDTVMNFTTAETTTSSTVIVVGPNTTTTITTTTINDGTDFLDFTSYLTSQFDSSTGGTDSADSNILIPVVLDYNEDSTLGGTGDGASNANLEANEVGAVRMANDASDGETFSALSAANVAALFNTSGGTNFGGDSMYGNLDSTNFDLQEYQKTDQEDLIGNAKAIFMVENAGNLGEYKVFELTWDGDLADGDDPVATAVELGSLDFGDSLTGFDDVNLVGSNDYAALLDNGFA